MMTCDAMARLVREMYEVADRNQEGGKGSRRL